MASLHLPTHRTTAAGGGGVGGGIIATFITYLIGAYVYGGGIAAGGAIAAVPDPVMLLVMAVVPGTSAYIAAWLAAVTPDP